ncbi:hypothetical protein R3P38DRAFT_2797515 [Favolaschia claudopus]|uniref:F-box domain-containing protein n=1 Tax=Favolaschia claudopus TaxID=2862362 RepID=A0AAW0A3G9_9AGAR
MPFAKILKSSVSRAPYTGPRLPSELWSEIFLVVCGSFCESPNDYAARVLALCAVHTVWFGMILAESRLWTGLYIDHKVSLDFVRTVTVHSQQQPMHLFVVANSDDDMCFGIHFGRIIPLLSTILGRSHRISLFSNSYFDATALLRWLSTATAKRVSRLDFDFPFGFEFEDTDYSFDGLLPFSVITTLVFRYTFVLFPWTTFASSVSRLRIGPISTRGSGGITWNSLSHMLSSCHALTHLFFDEVECADAPYALMNPKIECTMPLVRYMGVVCESYTTGFMMQLFGVPALSDLYFESRTQTLNFLAGGLIGISIDFLATVKTLCMTIEIHHPTVMLQVLKAFPSLEILDLRLSSRCTVQSLSKVRDFYPAPLCSFLRTIHVAYREKNKVLRGIMCGREPGHFTRDCKMVVTMAGICAPYAEKCFKGKRGSLKGLPYEPPPADAFDW